MRQYTYLLFLFFWEHISFSNDIAFCPSYIVVYATQILNIIFYEIGIIIGKIGSIMVDICVGEILDTIIYIQVVLVELFSSISYINHGIEYVATIFENHVRIYYTSNIIYYSMLIVLLIIIVKIIFQKK